MLRGGAIEYNDGAGRDQAFVIFLRSHGSPGDVRRRVQCPGPQGRIIRDEQHGDLAGGGRGQLDACVGRQRVRIRQSDDHGAAIARHLEGDFRAAARWDSDLLRIDLDPISIDHQRGSDRSAPEIDGTGEARHPRAGFNRSSQAHFTDRDVLALTAYQAKRDGGGLRREPALERERAVRHSHDLSTEARPAGRESSCGTQRGGHISRPVLRLE